VQVFTDYANCLTGYQYHKIDPVMCFTDGYQKITWHTSRTG